MGGDVFRSVIEAAVPIEEVRVMDAEIAWRARGRGALLLRIGEALDKLFTAGAHEIHIGCSSVDAYAKQYCGRSGRWASELRTLWQRLAELPLLRVAYKVGHLDHSMAIVLARYATPETEKEIFIRSMSSTVRAMERELKAAGKPEGAAPTAETDPIESDEPTWWVTVQRTLPREDIARFEIMRMAIQGLEEHSSGGQWLEWLLAETATTMINEGLDVMREDVVEEHEKWRERRAQAEARRDAREAKAARVVLEQRVYEDAFVEEEPLPDDPYELHELIKQLCAELGSRELFLGRMLDKFVRMRGPKRLGYADEVQYARERLGMSRSTMRQRIALARQTQGLPRVRDALCDAEIGWTAAERIARVAEPETEQLWIDRANKRTFKHLREELDGVEMVARVTGDRRALVPPSEEDLEHIQAIERDVLVGELQDGLDGFEEDSALAEAFVRMSACGAGDHAGVGLGEKAGLDPGTDRLGRGRWSLRTPDDVALHFKELETVHREAGLPGTFVQYMCRSFFEAWGPYLNKDMKWGEVHARDRFRCVSPLCDSRSITLHHYRYRSAGGTDDRENTGSPCHTDHLGNIHTHHSIKLYPPASKPLWVFGKYKTVLMVEGREMKRAG